MKFRLMQICHGVPGLRLLAKNVHPRWFFKWTSFSVALGSRFSPRTRRRLRPFLIAMENRFDTSELHRRGRRFLFYHRLFHDLVSAWTNWENSYARWVEFDGETYLREALKAGKGAFLISGHDAGFSKFVAPVLALKGYTINRSGGGKPVSRRIDRWGNGYKVGWRYINFNPQDDYWRRLAALKEIRSAIGRNEIVHVSPLWRRAGEPETAVSLWNTQFFFDPTWFRIIESCQSPVLPCLSGVDPNGTLAIRIFPSLPPERNAIFQKYGEILSEYLNAQPEQARFWKAYLRGEETW